jgi:hypothetical protein
MAVSGTYTTVNAVGIREDLTNTISRIDPTETPFFSSIGKGKAKAKYHEWQIQRLASAATVGSNSSLDGEDAKEASTTPTARVGNRTQIMTKTAKVSGGLQAVDTAGRANEMAYQVLLKGLELKRDIEVQLVQNGASRADNGTNTGLSASFESWLTTNVSRGAGTSTAGASGGFSSGTVSAPTDADSTRTFTEALLKPVLASTYSAGGKPSLIMLGALQKQVFSGFAGLSQSRVTIPSKTKAQAAIIAAADIYVGDFGALAAVPNIFQRNRSALLVSPKYAKVAYLRGMRNWALAKTGDADKRQLLVEFTLEMLNEAAHGVVADLS